MGTDARTKCVHLQANRRGISGCAGAGWSMDLRRSSRAARVALLAVLVAGAAAAHAQTQERASVITEIVVEGNKFVTKDSILARMGTKVGQPYVQATLDQDREALERLGFFKAVDVRATPLEGQNWKVTVQVSEFDIVKEIRIVGNTVIPTEDIAKAITITTDRPYNLNEAKPSADAISKLYSAKGYFALVEQLEPLEDSPGTVSVVIREMKVNSITVTGNTRTSERVMKRLIKTQPGEAYNDPKFVRDLQRILNTQWFDRVNPTEKQTEDGFGVDLQVDVKEARTGQVIVGATVDPRSSFAGQIRLLDTNFRGTGQTFGINLQQAVTGGGLSVELEYTNPFIDRFDTSLSVQLYSRLLYRFTNSSFGSSSTLTDDRFTERRTGGAVGIVRPFSDQLSASVGLKYETIKTSNVNLTAQSGFVKQDGNLAMLSLGLTSNRRDLDLDPARGDWWRLSVEPGFSHITSVGGAFPDQSLLGSSTFVRSSAEYRTYFSPQPPRTSREIDAPRRVVALRARAGTITGKVPFNEQFFVGGSDTLRGYQDDRFWGKSYLSASAEYRHPLQKSFNAIIFVDYAGAWGGYGGVKDFTQDGKFKMHLGYGVGFSFKTPLGPLRLDFGFNQRGGSRAHFQIGTSF